MFKENLCNYGNGYYMNNFKQLKIGKVNVCIIIFFEILLYVVYGLIQQKLGFILMVKKIDFSDIFC